jgi:hypothetical protein
MPSSTDADADTGSQFDGDDVWRIRDQKEDMVNQSRRIR